MTKPITPTFILIFKTLRTFHKIGDYDTVEVNLGESTSDAVSTAYSSQDRESS